MSQNNIKNRSDIAGTELKAILHSKRANIYYLEHCRVMQKDGRVLYLFEPKPGQKDNLYFNIPIANTTCLILGSGTSLTQAAMRLLASAGVLVGFCGGGATPLFSASEIEWLTPQSEYRPTEYVQGWLSWWFSDEARLNGAKQLQLKRLQFLTHIWSKDSDLKAAGFDATKPQIADLLNQHAEEVPRQSSTMNLLQLEARLTKQLYRIAATQTQSGGFSRDHSGVDLANTFLNHGNYLAYGLGATTCWVLGIPHGFALMHGKTRRGALVFDIADLIKDAIVLPLAFICASESATEQSFRQECLRKFTQHKALDYMFEAVKELALDRMLRP